MTAHIIGVHAQHSGNEPYAGMAVAFQLLAKSLTHRTMGSFKITFERSFLLL